MRKEFNDLERYSWAAKRKKDINNEHKAGFIHKDMPVTNPVMIHISEDTLKKLKRGKDGK